MCLKAEVPPWGIQVLPVIKHIGSQRDWDPWTWPSLLPKRCWQSTPWQHSSVSATNTRSAKQIKMSGGCRDTFYVPSFTALVMPTIALHIALAAPPPHPVLRDLCWWKRRIATSSCLRSDPRTTPCSSSPPEPPAHPAPPLSETDLPHSGISCSRKFVKINWRSLIAQVFTKQHKPVVYILGKNTDCKCQICCRIWDLTGRHWIKLVHS